MYNLLLTKTWRANMAEIETKRKAGRPNKYPEGYKEYWRKKLGKPKHPELRADGKPKHFRIRRTRAQLKKAKHDKHAARNNVYVRSPETKKLLAGTTIQREKIHIFRMSQYITIGRIEMAIKAVQESPEGLVVHEFFLKALGSLYVTTVFSFFLYMEHHLGVNEYPDSYFCCIYRHITTYCGINHNRVAKAIKQMEQAGLIDRKLNGVPAKMHYRINKIVMMDLLYEANRPSDYKGQSVLVES